MIPSRSNRTFKASEHGATLVEYTMMVAVIMMVCWAAVTFMNNKKRDDRAHKQPSPVTVATKYNYRGKILSCVDFLRMEDIGGGSLSCNFESYYAHPRKVDPDHPLGKPPVIKLEYNGHPLYCIQPNANSSSWKYRRASCDFVRYYQREAS